MSSLRLSTALFFFICSATQVHALTSMIVSYEQLVRSLEMGDDIKAIVRFDRCNLMDLSLQQELVPYLDGSSTRFNFNQYLHYKTRFNGQLRDTVTTTITTYVDKDNGQLWTLTGRLNIYDDNTATIHVDYYDPAHNQNQFAVDWRCDLSNGRDGYGIYLFNDF